VRIAVVGAGAMGSVYAGLLADAGNEVFAIDTWREHVEAIRQRGLRVEGASGDRTVRLHATDDPAEAGAVDLVVIATKARDVETAAELARPLLGPGTVVLPIQNGLGSADRVARILGEEHVAIGVAGGFGASVVAPGHVHHNGWELIRLGERRGKVTPRIQRVAEVWRDAGFQVATFDDVDRLVWEKLVCNAAFSGVCALLETTVGEVLEDADAWSVAEACAREAFAVAHASGIELGFSDPSAYVRAFGERIPDARPSMLLDLLAGRPCEVDVINGAIAPVAQAVGLEAPVNEAIAALVRAKQARILGGPVRRSDASSG
jgi:2-dehydropantoate 2-reductase